MSSITPSLDAGSRYSGNPARLASNVGMCIRGVAIWGNGFTLSPEDAQGLIRLDSRNRDVLLPYVGGHDLNSRPDLSGSRWVIDFQGWPEERAKTYRECYTQVLREVKPERQKTNKAAFRDYWWQHGERRPELRRAIEGLGQVIAMALVSRTVMPVLVQTGPVFSHKVAIFATSETAILAVLSSAHHYWWTVRNSSTMKADVNYSPTDVFQTLPLPALTQALHQSGEALSTYRRDVMLSRQAGLTATYNLVFDPKCNDDDIVELRRIHRDIDDAVCYAYGWEDIVGSGLDHGFHRAGAYIRYTVGPTVQREILDRLLELNHERYAEEVTKGLHDKKVSRKAVNAEQGTLI